MNPEENKSAENTSQSEVDGRGNSKDFGKVIDALHNKSKLASLRTYQGDMAEFIKSKDESIISVVVKEKERKQERETKAEKINITQKLNEPNASKKSGLQINFTMLFLSLLFIGGGAFAIYYVFQFIKTQPQNNQVTFKEEIIPYNNSVTLANMTSKTLGGELIKISANNGINIVKISSVSGMTIPKVKDLFKFLEIAPPNALMRTLKDGYVVGLVSQNKQNSAFMVIVVNDFGTAFTSMLEWEETMTKDLAFLNPEIKEDIALVPATPVVTLVTATTTKGTISTTATTTGTTTVVKKTTKPEIFVWKDIIIKNKDTRGLVNEKGESRIAYTFLDKNTILIAGNIDILGEISSVYASRSFTR